MKKHFNNVYEEVVAAQLRTVAHTDDSHRAAKIRNHVTESIGHANLSRHAKTRRTFGEDVARHMRDIEMILACVCYDHYVEKPRRDSLKDFRRVIDDNRKKIYNARTL